MTASQLASYDSFKRLLLEKLGMDDGLTVHFSASLLAGLVATTLCSPVDVIKTRVMSAKEKEGVFTLLARIYAKEGVTWCFKGWLPVSRLVIEKRRFTNSPIVIHTTWTTYYRNILVSGEAQEDLPAILSA